MSTNQLNKNKFILKENIHNVISFCYFVLLTFLMIFILLISSMVKNILLISISIFVISFSIMKLILQVTMMIKFKKLKENIESDESIYFYITKSWLRKKQSTIFLSIGILYINIILIIISAIIPFFLAGSHNFFATSILAILFLLVIVTAYFNNQIMDEYLKMSKKKINFTSIELIQLKKEQKLFYRSILYWIIATTLIVPLILMVFPGYRSFIKNKIRK